jgi:hypothetical protein
MNGIHPLCLMLRLLILRRLIIKLLVMVLAIVSLPAAGHTQSAFRKGQGKVDEGLISPKAYTLIFGLLPEIIANLRGLSEALEESDRWKKTLAEMPDDVSFLETQWLRSQAKERTKLRPATYKISLEGDYDFLLAIEKDVLRWRAEKKDTSGIYDRLRDVRNDLRVKAEHCRNSAGG